MIVATYFICLIPFAICISIHLFTQMPPPPVLDYLAILAAHCYALLVFLTVNQQWRAARKEMEGEWVEVVRKWGARIGVVKRKQKDGFREGWISGPVCGSTNMLDDMGKSSVAPAALPAQQPSADLN